MTFTYTGPAHPLPPCVGPAHHLKQHPIRPLVRERDGSLIAVDPRDRCWLIPSPIGATE